MVQMLLEHIEQHSHAGTVMHKLELMGGKLIDHDAVRLDLFHHIETGDADVAGQDGIAPRRLQQMVNQRGGGAFPFGAGDPDGLAMELTEEQVGLRGDFNALDVDVFQGDSRGLDDDIVIAHRLQIMVAEVGHAFHLVFVGHRHLRVRQVLVQETQGGSPFPAKAKHEDAFPFEAVQYQVKHKVSFSID